jgi:hypothetical protein
MPEPVWCVMPVLAGRVILRTCRSVYICILAVRWRRASGRRSGRREDAGTGQDQPPTAMERSRLDVAARGCSAHTCSRGCTPKVAIRSDYVFATSATILDAFGRPICSSARTSPTHSIRSASVDISMAMQPAGRVSSRLKYARFDGRQPDTLILRSSTVSAPHMYQRLEVDVGGGTTRDHFERNRSGNTGMIS